MKHILMSVFVLVFPFLVVRPVLATDRTPTIVNLPKTETVNGEYFAAGDSVTVSGTVNGDAYVAGGTVVMDGVVNGDLLVTGGTIHIRGSVLHDIRVLGGTVDLAGKVGGNVTAGSGEFSLSKDATVNGSMIVGGGNVTLMGTIAKDVLAGAGTLTVGSSVGGNVKSWDGQLTLTPEAAIKGDLLYWSETQTIPADAKNVAGALVYHNIPKTQKDPTTLTEEGMKGLAKVAGGLAAVFGFVRLLAVFVLGLILSAMFPVFTENAVRTMEKNTWGAFGAGLIVMIVLPALAVTAFFTLIGIPLSVLLSISVPVLWCVGMAFAALFSGRAILRGFHADPHIAWQLVTGVAALTVLSVIPVLGWLARGILACIGIGALTMEKQRVYRQLRAKRLI